MTVCAVAKHYLPEDVTEPAAGLHKVLGAAERE